ncbi:tRNA(Ile)-lysidine synthetase [Indibacter alkaliphilus LW1]|uniref:tRNA(Ile)-lysidine synthase n=1 Tax=Indibacter alkaliphilus (strain CCUG 57479 / KCTC 22604 / LW1) TaxID=1189612 RepID=S2DNV4_INDAL|nr:tRNA lysidine(34) synthetase TilS [Indibacter alkaliphilus]EPA00598.1 tRNA(Ile)-lysidine synthetase [Indibacter alkaliphilus LW1]
MVERLIQHIRSKNLLDQKGKYLLALSGGLDSVSLGYLLKEADIEFEIAHVNFGLRAEESDGDAAFVEELAKKWGKINHIHKVLPDAFEVPGQSTQMIARKIRYDWFSELIRERKLDGVLVAHHFTDQIETVLLNLLRGTGIEGVYGMADKKIDVIRPLLPFQREELMAYMLDKGYSWRDDSSNEKLIYKRNFIRKIVIPALEEGYPDALRSLNDSFDRIKDTGKAFFHLFDNWQKENIINEGDAQYLALKCLGNLPGKSSMIYYWLRNYGFNISDVEDLIKAIEEGHSGKNFHSDEYFLNLDREYLILARSDFEWESQSIEKNDISMSFKFGKYDLLHVKKDFPLDKNPENAMFDEEKLRFPLKLRKWQTGDKFMPLGMQKEKKVSDFLIDLKVPLVEKKKVAVLESGGQIIWVVGYRIAEQFKCKEESKHILYFKKR